MQENYEYLYTFNFGKRCYVVLKNKDKIKYFEKVDGDYIMPIISFNLLDNEGKSLTHVNQHFFMNQLTNRLNDAFRKKIFVNNNECINYLNDLNSKIINDVLLKKLFKGSNMKQIDDYNFELNKKEIVSYLDKFRFDTYIDYNNVSIFNGSIDKNSVSVIKDDPNNIVSNDVVVNNSISDTENNIETVSSDNYFNLIDNNVNNTNIDLFKSDIVNSSINNNNIFNQNDNIVQEPAIDNVDLNSFISDMDNNVETVSSDDYFNSVNSNNDVNLLKNDTFVGNEFNSSVLESIAEPEDIDIIQEPVVENNTDESFGSSNINFGSDVVNPFAGNNLVESGNVSVIQEPVVENNADESFGNSNINFGSDVVNPFGGNNLVDFNNGSMTTETSINNNVDVVSNELSNQSYIDQVKSRIENNNPQFGAISNTNVNSLNNINFGNEMGSDNSNFSLSHKENVISDNSIADDLQELENIDNEVSEVNNKNVEVKKKKKGNLLLTLIIIALVIAIALFVVVNFVM